MLQFLMRYMRNLQRLLLLIILVFGVHSFVKAQLIVNSLNELLPLLDDDNANVKVAPGTYSISADDITAGTYSNPLFVFSGNNSTFDFSGVTIHFSTDLLTKIAESVIQIHITGNNNVLKNLSMSDVGENVKPRDGGVNIVIDGMNNRVEGFDMSVKGSYPYGYGDAFGKGATVVIKHYKHSAVLVRGTSNHLLNCKIKQRAYGHCVFMQAAVDPLIEGCYIEGEMRSTDDMLAETSGPAYDVDFMTVWGYKLPPGFMMSLQEAGIRAYTDGVTEINGVEISRNTSDPTVKNCTVKNVRAGVTLTHAKGTETVIGTTCLGCERGFAIGTGSIVDCSADVIYGPALALDETSSSSTTADVTLLWSDEEYYNGSGQAVSLTGNGYDITIRGDVSYPNQDLAIEISGIYKDIRNYSITDLTSTSNVRIHNLSGYPLILGPKSNSTTGESGGMITDLGTNNKVEAIPAPVLSIWAKDYSDASNDVSTGLTSDGDTIILNIGEASYLEYEFTIPAAGSYLFDFFVSGIADGTFNVELNNETIDHLNLKLTEGNDIWETLRSSSPVYLTKGVKTMRISSTVAGWNLSKMLLLSECYDTPIIPYIKTTNSIGAELSNEQTAKAVIFPGVNVSLTPEPSIGGKWSWIGPNGFTSRSREVLLNDVQLSDGGVYVATFTNDCGLQNEIEFTVNVTNTLRFEAEAYDTMDGTLLNTSTGNAELDHVYDINEGDYLEFDLVVPFTANYRMNYNVSSESSGGGFIVSSNNTEIETVGFAATNGVQNWTTVSSLSAVRFTAGMHTLKIKSVLANSDWSLNWFEIQIDQILSPCDFPFTSENVFIRNESYYWSTGAMDISCEESVSFFANISGTKTLESTDSLNVYYRLDGGEPVPISENAGVFDDQLIYADSLKGSTLEIIIQAFSGSPDKIFKISDILIQNGSIVLSRKIEAESYNNKIEGTQLVVENCADDNGKQLGYVSSGDWTMYRNVDLTAITGVEARISSKSSSGTIQLRLGSPTGTLLGLIRFEKTGSWNLYATESSKISTTETGLHDVYFVYSGGLNINWFKIYASLIPPLSTGLSETKTNEVLSETLMFPNPVTDMLYLRNVRHGDLEVYNCTGQLLKKIIIQSENQTVDFSDFKAGMYIVKVSDGNKIITQKVLKQ